MKNTNILSALLVIVFMISCLTFFSASASDNKQNTNEPQTSEVQTSEHQAETTLPTSKNPQPTSVVTTQPSEAVNVTTSTSNNYTSAANTTNTTVPTTVATATKATATATDPQIETDTVATQAALVESTVASNEGNTEKQTKQTKKIKITEAPTSKKNITNYGSKYRPMKYVSLIVMIGSIIALIAVNVRYQKKYGKSAKKTKKKSPTNGVKKFDNKSAHSDPFDGIDNSKKSNKSTLNNSYDISSFRKQSKIDNDIYSNSSKKSNDDDLYI